MKVEVCASIANTTQQELTVSIARKVITVLKTLVSLIQIHAGYAHAKM
jgi:hypothetical protein